jgi:hypothetical protein
MPIPQKFWRFVPVLENSGNTFTKGLRIYPIAGSVVAPDDFVPKSSQGVVTNIRPKLFYAPPDPEEGNIIPVLKRHNYIISPHSSLDVGGIDITTDYLKPGGAEWFLYGWAQYNDIFFGTSIHKTKFCYAINPLPTKGEQKPDVTLCGHWNCTDSDCEEDQKSYEADIADPIIGKPKF